MKNDSTVQGRISVKVDGGVADVDIVETAPHNYDHAGIYEGVGAHLFAIACQVSLDAGCDGFVAFTSKSDLVEYYKEKLNVGIFRDRRMYIDENAAQILLDKYMRVGDSMLAMTEKMKDYTHDIAYYARDSRLTEPSDGTRYEWRKMIELSKELGRPLTDTEAERFRIE